MSEKSFQPLTKEYAERLAKLLDEYDEMKDELHDLSRQIIKDSKLCIYAIRRGELERAERLVKEMNELREKLKGLLKANLRLATINIALTAEQEYVEALSIYLFEKERRFPTLEEADTTVQEYVAGIMDAAGELLRMAVDKMLKGDLEYPKEVKDAIENIYVFMLYVNPRDYELRRKIDYVSNILNKLQEFIFYKEVMGSVRTETGAEK
ncbi:haloacid dehalogenase [Ignicoccus hospitalis]|uniref:Translin n=1 Tax=Ignicoccus hospitalis (strain KIN4/I / DSM 18386 / JCM 14125) TaxID=453591 RepID=A8AAR6_IGNH4|nr:haloacid dehalogenase [Ignicoccus hospitalis]ABU82018.1 Translin [Ignicoccus hospitalis KIN4/I]HIH90975.1 haloacid dehalogenase [Desulfurococcaceae archaeon]